MVKDPTDIKDDEIRIISKKLSKKWNKESWLLESDMSIENEDDYESDCDTLQLPHSNEPEKVSIDKEIHPVSMEGQKSKNKRRLFVALIFIAVAIAAGACFLFIPKLAISSDSQISDPRESVNEKSAVGALSKGPNSGVKGFTIARDTIINGLGLLILTPENARPRLVIGIEALKNPDIILATQAADVRADNGEIAGAFVLDGELISKGGAKAGYCSIINGNLTIGFAEATPMLEETLTDGGYFFRQYPLVMSGQIVENKPKGKSIRKALAEIEGKISVITSKDPLTFHDFSQLLIDAGVRNAIYLVGSTSYGFFMDGQGEKILIGQARETYFRYINFIIWE